MQSMVCLVSRQAMANAIPVLMYMPRQVHLLATPEEESRARYLQALFKGKGIAVALHAGLNAYNTSALADECRGILRAEGSNTALNVTGGTKLMALEAFRVFAEAGNTVLYCDTEHKHIITLSPQRQTAPITLQLSIRDYLAAHGYTITAIKNTQPPAAFMPILVGLLDAALLLEFTDFAKKARPKLKSKTPGWSLASAGKNFHLQKTPVALTLRFNGGAQPVTVTDKVFKFIDGDWLEYLVNVHLTQTLGVEALIGVKILSPNLVENEIDALVLHNFTLHLISCKSGNYKSEKANTALYEVETLRTLAGGTLGKAVAVLAETAPAIERRAKDMNVTPVNIHHLKGLRL